MSLDAATSDRIRRLVLQNALEHDGVPRPGPVLARLLATVPELRARSAEVGSAVRATIDEVAQLPAERRQEELGRLGGPEVERPTRPRSETGVFPPLPGAEDGRVVLRLAPFPSGSLHIGNARMIFVNDYYRRLYHGRLLLVFDDTVGSEEKRIDLELFDVIRHDLEIAGVTPDAVYYKSDRVGLFYPWARRVIEANAAYVCRCAPLLLRENRLRGVACPERDQALETNLELWEKMLGGSFAPGEAVLRLRTDLHDPDPAFRDRVLFRISDLDHPRVGHRYRVWPLLEFSWAVDDVELGVTHVIRGKDLVMEDRMEEYLWNVLHLRGPPFVHWGLLRVKEAKISKSKSYGEVRSGLYDGWNDPRTWSIGSLDRRGITAEAMRRFTLSFGLSLADIEVPAETLYAENRAVIDATTPRRSFVADPVRVEVDGYPSELAAVELANHPDHPEMDRREVAAGPTFFLARADLAPRGGTEVRLKDLVNITLPPGPLPADGSPVRAAFAGRENRRIPRLQWVGATDAVEVDLLGVEGEHTRGLAEAAVRAARPRDHLQFERVGFVRVEADHVPGSVPVRICYGHP